MTPATGPDSIMRHRHLHRGFRRHHSRVGLHDAECPAEAGHREHFSSETR